MLARNAGDDRLFGGHGNDAVIDCLGSDRADGGHGDDVISYSEVELIGGTNGRDDDLLHGGEDDDILYPWCPTPLATVWRLSSKACRVVAKVQSNPADRRGAFVGCQDRVF